jgi:hypothetical protein
VRLTWKKYTKYKISRKFQRFSGTGTILAVVADIEGKFRAECIIEDDNRVLNAARPYKVDGCVLLGDVHVRAATMNYIS